MVSTQRGLVIGKFRPPHKGHGLLIETALNHVARLTVLVCADLTDGIPAALRAEWLHELFPSAEVRVVETSGYDPDDSNLWADLTIGWLGEPPDVVFTSEAYGEAYATHLGCRHVCVDLARRQVPISGHQILQHPQAFSIYLDPPVRAYFVPRVVLVGAESTGKTTLAHALAHHYATAWVPEYGRTYWDGLLTLPRIDCTTEDFIHIAAQQQAMEARLARHARRVLICDTDAFATRLWHERYLREDAAHIRDLAQARWRALYILTGDEIPWEDDGTRDRQEERSWFHEKFREEIARVGHPSVEVRGSVDERLAQAVRAIDQFIAG